MSKIDWLGTGARIFAVLSLSVGVGFLAGAIAFTKIGREGMIYGGPFAHVSDLIGWGSGLLAASLATFAFIVFGKRSNPTKPTSGDYL